MSLIQDEGISDSRTLERLRNDLLEKEQSLMVESKAANGFGKQSLQVQTDFQIYSADFAENLKREVVKIIANKEEELEA